MPQDDYMTMYFQQRERYLRLLAAACEIRPRLWMLCGPEEGPYQDEWLVPELERFLLIVETQKDDLL